MSAAVTRNYSQARAALREALDEAERGRAPIITRGGGRIVLADAERLRECLALFITDRPQVYTDEGVFTLIMESVGIGTESADFEAAVADLILALREYAEDWPRLQEAPNHRDNWGLVQLVLLSDDEQLRRWLLEL